MASGLYLQLQQVEFDQECTSHCKTHQRTIGAAWGWLSAEDKTLHLPDHTLWDFGIAALAMGASPHAAASVPMQQEGYWL